MDTPTRSRPQAFALSDLQSVLGAWITKRQGLGLLQSVRRERARGSMPPGAAMEGLLLGVAGVLFILPGFVSDVVALILVVRPIRKRIAQRLRRGWFRTGWNSQTSIDVE